MDIFSVNRKEKTLILERIIRNLQISDAEKDLYVFSMGVLSQEDFDKFFQKTLTDFQSIAL